MARCDQRIMITKRNIDETRERLLFIKGITFISARKNLSFRKFMHLDKRFDFLPNVSKASKVLNVI